MSASASIVWASVDPQGISFSHGVSLFWHRALMARSRHRRRGRGKSAVLLAQIRLFCRDLCYTRPLGKGDVGPHITKVRRRR